MNKLKIINRALTDYEINKLMHEIKFYPDLTFISRNHWKKMKKIYILEVNKQFAGVCAVYEFADWVKFGPLALLKEFHGKGYGKLLVTNLINNYSRKHIIVATTNPILKRIMKKLNFVQNESIFTLPFIVKIFLIKQLLKNISIQAFLEAVRKMVIFKRHSFSYFIKYSL